MNNKLILGLVAALIFTIPSVFAEMTYEEFREQRQQEAAEREMSKDLDISLNRDNFVLQQTGVLSITSSTFMEGRELDMKIVDAAGNVITDWQIPIQSEDAIQYRILFGSIDFEKAGQYTIIAKYDDATAQDTFSLTIPESRANPAPQLNDRLQREEGFNPADGAKDRMIEQLQNENVQLRAQLNATNERLDNLNAVLMEQINVINDLASEIRNFHATIGEWFQFNLFA